MTLIDTVAVSAPGAAAPAEVALLTPPLSRRRVWLRNDAGAVLGYAVSYWAAADLARHLPDPAQPIGAAVSTGRLEQHRDLGGVYAGAPLAPLQAALGARDGARLWARHYLVSHGGRPLAVVCEAFAPGLERWLGPERVDV